MAELDLLRAQTRGRTSVRRERRAGYVLVELLLALAIIAMIAALALPSASATRSPSALRARALDVAVLMRAARNEAVRSGEPVSVQLDGRARRIRSEAGVLVLPRDVAVRFAVPGRADFAFSADGRATAGDVLLASGRATEVVRVDPTTAAVYVMPRR